MFFWKTGSESLFVQLHQYMNIRRSSSPKELEQLRELNLSYSQITDVGLKHLKGLAQLVTLSLTGTRVSDAGLECLTGLSQARYLWLDGTAITAQGEELHRLFPHCSVR